MKPKGQNTAGLRVGAILTIAVLLASSILMPPCIENGKDALKVPVTRDWNSFSKQVAPKDSTYYLTILAHSVVQLNQRTTDNHQINSAAELFIYYRQTDSNRYGDIIIVWNFDGAVVKDAIKNYDKLTSMGIEFFLFNADDFKVTWLNFINPKDLTTLSFVHYISPKYSNETRGFKIFNLNIDLPSKLKFVWNIFVAGERKAKDVQPEAGWWGFTKVLIDSFEVTYAIVDVIMICVDPAAGMLMLTLEPLMKEGVIALSCGMIRAIGDSYYGSKEINAKHPFVSSYWLPLTGYGEIDRGKKSGTSLIGPTGVENQFYDPPGFDHYYQDMAIHLTAYAPMKVGFQLSSYAAPPNAIPAPVKGGAKVSFEGVKDNANCPWPPYREKDSDLNTSQSLSPLTGEFTWQWLVTPIITSSDTADQAYGKSHRIAQYIESNYRLSNDLDASDQKNNYDQTAKIDVTLWISVDPHMLWEAGQTEKYYSLPTRVAVYGANYKEDPSNPSTFEKSDKVTAIHVIKGSIPGEQNPSISHLVLCPLVAYYIYVFYQNFKAEIIVPPFTESIVDPKDVIAIDDMKSYFVGFSALNGVTIVKPKLAYDSIEDFSDLTAVRPSFNNPIYIDPNVQLAVIWTPCNIQDLQYGVDPYWSFYNPIATPTTSNILAVTPGQIAYQNNLLYLTKGTPKGMYSTTIWIGDFPTYGDSTCTYEFTYPFTNAPKMTISKPLDTNTKTVLTVNTKTASNTVYIPRLSDISSSLTAVDLNYPSNCMVFTQQSNAVYDLVQYNIAPNAQNVCIQMSANTNAQFNILDSVAPSAPNNADKRLVVFVRTYSLHYRYDLYSTKIASGTKLVAEGDIWMTPFVTLNITQGNPDLADLKFTKDNSFPKLTVKIKSTDATFVTMNFQGYQADVSGGGGSDYDTWNLRIHNRGLFGDRYSISLDNLAQISKEYGVKLSSPQVNLSAGQSQNITLSIKPKEVIRQTVSGVPNGITEVIEKAPNFRSAIVRVKVQSANYPEICSYFYCTIGSAMDLGTANAVQISCNYTDASTITKITGMNINCTRSFNSSFVRLSGIMNVTGTLYLNDSVLVFDLPPTIMDKVKYPILNISSNGAVYLKNSTVYNLYGHKTNWNIDGSLRLTGPSKIFDANITTSANLTVKTGATLLLSNSKLLFKSTGNYKRGVFVDNTSTMVLSAGSVVDSANGYKYLITGGGKRVNLLESARNYGTYAADVKSTEPQKIVKYGTVGYTTFSVYVGNTGNFTETFSFSNSQPSTGWTVGYSKRTMTLNAGAYAYLTVYVNSTSSVPKEHLEDVHVCVRSTTDKDYMRAIDLFVLVKTQSTGGCVWVTPNDIITTVPLVEGSQFKVVCTVHNNGTTSATVDVVLRLNGVSKETYTGVVVAAFSTTSVQFRNYCTAGKGMNNVTVEVRQSGQLKSSTYRNIAAATKPVVKLEPSPGSGIFINVSEHLKVDGIGTNDSDGKVQDVSWNLGNGDTQYGKFLNYKYSTAGTYTVTCKAYDDQGLWNSSTFQVTVRNNASKPFPLIFLGNLTRPYSSTYTAYGMVFKNESMEFWGNYSLDYDSQTNNYTWTFKKVGSTQSDMKYGGHVSYKFTSNGTYNVTLKVTDAASNWNATTISINVANAPVPVIDQSSFNVSTSQTVYLNSTNSMTVRGVTITNCTWYVYNITLAYMYTGYTRNIQRSFTQAGTYYVCLQIRDSQNILAVRESWVVVHN